MFTFEAGQKVACTFMEVVSRVDDIAKTRAISVLNDAADLVQVLSAVVATLDMDDVVHLPVDDQSHRFWGTMALLVHAAHEYVVLRDKSRSFGSLGDIAGFTASYVNHAESEEYLSQMYEIRDAILASCGHILHGRMHGTWEACSEPGCRSVACEARRETQHLMYEMQARQAEAEAEETPTQATEPVAHAHNVIQFRRK